MSLLYINLSFKDRTYGNDVEPDNIKIKQKKKKRHLK